MSTEWARTLAMEARLAVEKQVWMTETGDG